MFQTLIVVQMTSICAAAKDEDEAAEHAARIAEHLQQNICAYFKRYRPDRGEAAVTIDRSTSATSLCRCRTSSSTPSMWKHGNEAGNDQTNCKSNGHRKNKAGRSPKIAVGLAQHPQVKISGEVILDYVYGGTLPNVIGDDGVAYSYIFLPEAVTDFALLWVDCWLFHNPNAEINNAEAWAEAVAGGNQILAERRQSATPSVIHLLIEAALSTSEKQLPTARSSSSRTWSRPRSSPRR